MTGIELIAKERQEQIEKHGITVEQDVNINKFAQLIDAAIILCRQIDIKWVLRYIGTILFGKK